VCEAYRVNGYSGGHQPDHETDFFGRTVPASSERGLFFLFLNLHRASGVPVLLALVAGKSAQRLEGLEDEEVGRGLRGSGWAVFGWAVCEGGRGGQSVRG
jgi:lysine-specific histone demethylase 1